MRHGLVGLLVLAVAGCGSGGSETAQATAAAQSYVAAFTAHDAGATCLAMTQRSREQVAEFARRRLHVRGATCAKAVALLPAPRAGARVGDVQVSGSHATAAVDGFDRPLRLTREQGRWRVEAAPSGETD